MAIGRVQLQTSNSTGEGDV